MRPKSNGWKLAFPFVRRLSGGVAGRTSQMNRQSGQTGGGGLFNNLWVQLALLVIAAIILVALAAKFVW
jgi:hypothetical protein